MAVFQHRYAHLLINIFQISIPAKFYAREVTEEMHGNS